jgi:hypothetical protein
VLHVWKVLVVSVKDFQTSAISKKRPEGGVFENFRYHAFSNRTFANCEHPPRAHGRARCREFGRFWQFPTRIFKHQQFQKNGLKRAFLKIFDTTRFLTELLRTSKTFRERTDERGVACLEGFGGFRQGFSNISNFKKTA